MFTPGNKNQTVLNQNGVLTKKSSSNRMPVLEIILHAPVQGEACFLPPRSVSFNLQKPWEAMALNCCWVRFFLSFSFVFHCHGHRNIGVKHGRNGL